MFNVPVTAKLLMHAKIKIYGIVAYTFINVCEKITSFCQVLKKKHAKENLVPFFLPHGVHC